MTEEEQRQQEKMDGTQAHLCKMNLGGPTNDGPYAIDIKFQLGPIKEVGVNGCQIEDVIDILVARLEGFQNGPYKCRENALSITKLQEAKHWLNHRTADRVKRDVEGKNER